MEVGFASLATFNRVFKQRQGEAPTTFRRRALGEALTKSRDDSSH
jgi:AraC-like DNA-binding protein